METKEVSWIIQSWFRHMEKATWDEFVIWLVAIVRKKWDSIDETRYNIVHNNMHYHDVAALKEYIHQQFIDGL